MTFNLNVQHGVGNNLLKIIILQFETPQLKFVK
jgi:hypothetical protein